MIKSLNEKIDASFINPNPNNPKAGKIFTEDYNLIFIKNTKEIKRYLKNKNLRSTLLTDVHI